MSATIERTDEAAAAAPLARTIHPDTGRPAGKLSGGRTLSYRLRGFAGRVATWRERRAAAGQLTWTSSRDRADIALSRAAAHNVFQHSPPTWPPFPPRPGRNDPTPQPGGSLLRLTLVYAFFALLAVAGVLVLDALGGTASSGPDGEDPTLVVLDGP